MNPIHAALIRLNCSLQMRGRKESRRSELRDVPEATYAVLKADGIGDFVLATAFLNVMDERFSRARITLFCNDLVEDLAKRLYPRWNVVSVRKNAHPGVGVWPSKPSGYRRLRSQSAFDMLLDLRSWRSCQDTTLTSWIPARWKLAVQNRVGQGALVARRESSVYDELVAPSSSYPGVEECEDLRNYQALAGRLFHRPEQCPEVRPFVKRLPLECFPEWAGVDAEQYLVVSPFAGAEIRHISNMLVINSVRGYLSARGNPMPVCVVGGPADLERSAQLASDISEFVKCINLTGKLSVTQTVGLIQQAHLFLGAESGMAHAAVASGVPSVVVIGGGHWGLFAPWKFDETRVRWVTHRLPCFHCNWSCIFDESKCIRGISALEVIESMRSLSQSPRPW